MALAGCAGGGQPAASSDPDLDPVAVAEVQAGDSAVPAAAAEPDESITADGGSRTAPAAESADDESGSGTGKKDPLLDRSQRVVYAVVNNTALWFDSLFGGSELEQRENVSQGRLTIGARWDERDGTKQRVRLKARVPLPALKNRARLVIGRGDTNDLVDGSASGEIDSLPDRFNDINDDDFFLGLGFSRDRGLGRGFDLGAGVAFESSSIQPYVQATYRWNRAFHERLLLRLRPRAFWQEERGTGGSLTAILDYVPRRDWLLRSWNILITDDEVAGLGWRSKLVAYQNFNARNAMAYGLFANGETDADVELQDYGVELRFRRRILREWLFMEIATSVGWPREFLDEERERNLGLSLEFEMQFGEWPRADSSSELVAPQ